MMSLLERKVRFRKECTGYVKKEMQYGCTYECQTGLA